MNLLSLMKILEGSGLVRVVENVSGFAGFDNCTVPVWQNEAGLTITVNEDSFSDLWKVFLIDDLEGLWWFAVFYRVGGNVTFRLFKVVDVLSVVFE